MLSERIKQYNREYKIILIAAAIFIVIVGLFFVGLAKTTKKEASSQGSVILQPQTNSEGGVSITVNSENFDFKNPQFLISFETHQGDLDFNIAEVAILTTNNTTEYRPLAWDGGTGGHHLSGILSFPAISEAKNIKLIIKNVYGIPAREFFWTIPQNI